MLAAIAIMPSAPVLVPELAGVGTAGELADLRTAVFAAAGSLPSHWVVIGAGPTRAVFGPDSVGTFAGFGVDLAVRLSPQSGQGADLPLCALIAGWVRGQVQPDACLRVHVYADTADAPTRGKQLRAEIDRAPEPVGVLVVADGANTLTPAAPGGYRPRHLDVQHALDDALASGDIGALIELPEPIVGRAGFAALAGLVGSGPRSAQELYRGAPYGVGYFVGVWQP
ncbi:MAG TPA: hypothetical protein VF299_04705 [Mycobacterium sp.]